MKLFEIKHQLTARVLFEKECDSLKICVEAAVKSRADLRGANLGGADLRRADLGGAYLRGANLRGAKWTEETTIQRAPIQIDSLDDGWPVYILDDHMQIGCELHSFDDWVGFDDRRILEMDGKPAAVFWKRYGPMLLALCETRREGEAK